MKSRFETVGLIAWLSRCLGFLEMSNVDSELVKMVLPYVVSAIIFVLIGIGFYLKDVVFNYLDQKKQAHWQRKYGDKVGVENKFRVKKIKDRSKTA